MLLRQTWILNPVTQWLQLRGDTTSSCVDLDFTDRNLEMYSCNTAVIKHQQWAYNTSTGAFTTLQDQSCMTAVAPDSAATTTSVAKRSSVSSAGQQQQQHHQQAAAVAAVAVDAVDAEIEEAEARLQQLRAQKQRLQEQQQQPVQ